MADGEIKIDAKLDNSGVEKGVDDLKKQIGSAGKQIDSAAKSTKTLSGGLAGISKSAITTAAGVAGVGVALKKTVDALNDCERAYKTQIKAENALATAAKNNPYLNAESVYNLKNFAGELQSMSEIGDEVSLQVMAQLAAAGRNETQIMQIMSAAADMAAVTGEDIASAAQKLNATLNGNAGTLGRQISDIDNLTKAELENGKAIEIVAAKYKGSAKATADVSIQLSNAWGDFKENIGRGWNNVTQPVKEFFLGVLNDINEATAKTNALKDQTKSDTATLSKGGVGITTVDEVKTYERQVKVLNEEIDALKQKKDLEVELGVMTQKEADAELRNDPEYKKLISQLATWGEKLRLARASYQETLDAQAAAEKAAQATAAQQKTDERNQQAAKYIKENTKAIEAQIEALGLKAEITGEAIDAQEVYNAYMQSYIDLITKSGGLITENNTAAKERLAILQEWAEKAQAAADKEERLKAANEIMSAAENFGNNTYWDNYINKSQELHEMQAELNAAEVEDEKRKADALKKIDEEILQNRKDLAANLASEINGYVQQTAQVINDAAALALETEKNRMQAELDDLETKYKKGEISEEEYQKKVAEAKKKGAEKQYQIEIAQWSANILAATANTAVGVTQAIAQGGVAGIITGALVAAAGAVQLASIIAAKPQKHFATGGFIGGINGASMGADNTTIAARNGELVVNANQQRRMWELLNGGNSRAAGGGFNVVVNNKASNVVRAKPQITEGQIELLIDRRVNESLKSGRYNESLNAAQSGMSGEFYGL